MNPNTAILKDVIGTIRVRQGEDDYVASIYINLGQGYRVIHVDTSSGQILESQVSNHVAERWPVIWEPK